MTTDKRFEGLDFHNMSLFERISVLDEEERDEILKGLSPEDLSSAKLWLRPKQMDVISSKAWLTLCLAGRGFGKPLSLDTPLPTPSGWITMGDIKTGDQVFDEHGKVRTVVQAHTPYIEDAVELTFTGDVKIVAGIDHQWKTITAFEKKQFGKTTGTRVPNDWASRVPVRTTREILSSFTYGVRNDLNHFIPTTDPLDLPPADLPIDPWLLGFWLAEGSGTILCTSRRDLPHVLEQLTRTGETVSGVNYDERSDAASVKTRGLTGRLRDLGLDPATIRSRTKFIPGVYLRASIDQRVALLQGLMDGDGCKGSQKNRRTNEAVNHAVYGTTSLQLHKDFNELLHSLGVRIYTRTKRAQLNGVDYGEAHETNFRPSKGGANPALLARRSFGDLTELKQADRHLSRTITGYEHLGPKVMRCITVDSPSSMYLCGEAMIPTHNTRVGAHWVIEKARTPGTRIALLGRTVADVRDVMIQGESGILSVSDESFMPRYSPSFRSLQWPNGSIAKTYSSEAVGQLRGPQQHYAWADELAAFKQVPDSSGLTAWDNLLISTRLGETPQILATTTPKRTDVIRRLVVDHEKDPERIKLISGSTLDNKANLSADYIRQVHDKYKGSALERQELYGEFVDSVEGAMWQEDYFQLKPLPDGHEIDMATVIAVDPGVTSGGDATGIIVVKTTLERDLTERKAWICEDLTVQGSPEEWATRVSEAYERHSTEFRPPIVIVEGNQGGELLRTVLLQENPRMQLAIIPAVKSKQARAEPVAHAYRRGRVFHVEDADLGDLEEEMLNWEPGISKWSPNRLDAAVHGIVSVFFDPKPLGRFSRILIGNMASNVTMASGAPNYRQSRGVGIGAAPWRAERAGSSGIRRPY